ncbi:MAG: hypothetical protein M1814_003904 [Vezdaea aestivalis]|nr:MAG: hypothetical protein M1814_003904 [Vezdaea aestivalis]
MKRATPSPAAPQSQLQRADASRAGALIAFNHPQPAAQKPARTYAGPNGALLAAVHVGARNDTLLHKAIGNAPAQRDVTAAGGFGGALAAAQISTQRRQSTSSVVGSATSDSQVINRRPSLRNGRPSVPPSSAALSAALHGTRQQDGRLSRQTLYSQQSDITPLNRLGPSGRLRELSRSQSDGVTAANEGTISPSVSRLIGLFEEGDLSEDEIAKPANVHPEQTRPNPIIADASKAEFHAPKPARPRSAHETALLAAQTSVKTMSRPESRCSGGLGLRERSGSVSHNHRNGDSRPDSRLSDAYFKEREHTRSLDLREAEHLSDLEISVRRLALKQSYGPTSEELNGQTQRTSIPPEVIKKRKSQVVPVSAAQSPTRTSLDGPRGRGQTTTARFLKPHITGDSFADAIVASSLASSRAPSPSKKLAPSVPPKRRSKGPMFFSPTSHSTVPSRTPSPSKGLKSTLRKPAKSDEEEDNRPRKHKSKLARKHPNKHHEGDRKRWKDAITERERKRYDGIWAANREGAQISLPTERYVSSLTVEKIWSRSRLQPEILEEVWSLVKSDDRDTLSREQFIVGLWLVDQRLKGRKLPTKVSSSVWISVRTIGNLKTGRKMT